VGLTIAAMVRNEFVIPARRAANFGAMSKTRTLKQKNNKKGKINFSNELGL